MSIILSKCPHCPADHVGFRVFGADLFPQRELSKSENKAMVSIGAQCPACHKPIAALVIMKKAFDAKTFNWEKIQVAAKNLVTSPNRIEDLGVELISLWPEPGKPNVPENIPPDVARVYIQAERNFPTR
jgi:hypothetical protein